jgi:hypothetical protein
MYLQRLLSRITSEASKLKNPVNRCISLGSWLKSMKKQIWHSIGSCEGNLDKLIERDDPGITQHVVAIHEILENQL